MHGEHSGRQGRSSGKGPAKGPLAAGWGAAFGFGSGGPRPWLLAGGLVLVAAGTVACCSTLFGWFGRKQVERIDIVLTQMEAVVKPVLDLSVEFTCELRNANPSWVDVVRMEYCMEVNNVRMQCGRYPSSEQKVRVAAGETVEARVKVVPTAEMAGKLVDSILKGPVVPEARIVGTAHIDSPVGSLDFDFKTRPMQFELRRLGIQVELPSSNQVMP